MSDLAFWISRYPWIFAWAKLMGSFDYYPLEQAKIALSDNAPSTAIFRRQDEPGVWATVETIQNQLSLNTLRQIATGMGLDCAPIDVAEKESK